MNDPSETQIRELPWMAWYIHVPSPEYLKFDQMPGFVHFFSKAWKCTGWDSFGGAGVIEWRQIEVFPGLLVEHDGRSCVSALVKPVGKNRECRVSSLAAGDLSLVSEGTGRRAEEDKIESWVVPPRPNNVGGMEKFAETVVFMTSWS